MEVVNVMGCSLDCIMIGGGRMPKMSNFQPKLGCESMSYEFLVIGVFCLPKCSKIIEDTLGLADLKMKSIAMKNVEERENKIE